MRSRYIRPSYPLSVPIYSPISSVIAEKNRYDGGSRRNRNADIYALIYTVHQMELLIDRLSVAIELAASSWRVATMMTGVISDGCIRHRDPPNKYRNGSDPHQ
ncbi:hypothetical protein ACLOJK_010318 [Asimina triloba]